MEMATRVDVHQAWSNDPRRTVYTPTGVSFCCAYDGSRTDVLSPTQGVSKRRVKPTRLLGWEGSVAGAAGGVASGQLWLASADWAHDVAFLQAVRCTLVWEALDPWCQNRARVTERRRAIEASGIRVLVWVLNGPQRKQVSMEQAHAVIREEVEYGGVVLCHCINAHHRSTCSVASFLIRECKLSVAQAAAIIWQHKWQKLHEVRDEQLAILKELEDEFAWRGASCVPDQALGSRPPSSPVPLWARFANFPPPPDPTPPEDEPGEHDTRDAVAGAAGASRSSPWWAEDSSVAGAAGASGSSPWRAGEAAAAGASGSSSRWAEEDSAAGAAGASTGDASVAGAAGASTGDAPAAGAAGVGAAEEPKMTGSQQRAAERLDTAKFAVNLSEEPAAVERIKKRSTRETKLAEEFRRRALQKHKEREEAAKTAKERIYEV